MKRRPASTDLLPVGGKRRRRPGLDLVVDRHLDRQEAAVRRARQAAGNNDVLVLGADVARRLLRADLLDELRIHLVPLLLGDGTPLFDGEHAELIQEGKAVTGTVTHLRFRIAKA